MEFREISPDAVNSRFRDKSAIYKNIPKLMKTNTRPTSPVDFVGKLSCDTF